MEKTDKKKAMMLEHLEKSLGIASVSCKAVGISRTIHYDWLKTDAEYKKAVDELLEVSLDMAETSLLNQIRDKNTSATIFYLKTKGRNRGYIERHEISGIDNEPIIVKIVDGTSN